MAESSPGGEAALVPPQGCRLAPRMAVALEEYQRAAVAHA